MENRETEQMEPFRLEMAFDQIEQLLQKLQEGEVSLEESFRLYEQGMKLLQKCNENIDHVEKQMLQIDEEGHTHEFS